MLKRKKGTASLIAHEFRQTSVSTQTVSGEGLDAADMVYCMNPLPGFSRSSADSSYLISVYLRAKPVMLLLQLNAINDIYKATKTQLKVKSY